MELLLIRHGESLADLEDRHEGRADYPLTKMGHIQAERLARWLDKEYDIDLIISSPLNRARTTAEYISKETESKLILEDILMEWNNGLLAGMLREDAIKKFPIPQGGRKTYHEFAESESYINFRGRAEMFWSRFIDEYINKDKYKRICIVSHGGMINMLFRSIMNLPINTDINISSGDTGVHLIDLNEDSIRIKFINKQEHLLE